MPNVHVRQRFEMELSEIPEHLRDAFRAYFLNGQPPAGLVYSILCGNLFDVHVRADRDTREEMPAIVQFVIDGLPQRSYGSPALIAAWIASGGIEGGNGRKAA